MNLFRFEAFAKPFWFRAPTYTGPCLTERGAGNVRGLFGQRGGTVYIGVGTLILIIILILLLT